MALAKSIIAVVLTFLMMTTMGYCGFRPQSLVRVPNVGDYAGVLEPKYNELVSTNTHSNTEYCPPTERGEGDHSLQQTLETSEGPGNFPPELMVGAAIFFVLFFYGGYFVAFGAPLLVILFVLGAAFVLFSSR